jgi:hypothetical protein
VRLALALASCVGETPADDQTTSDTDLDEPFEVVLDNVPGGALLSAWSDGDDLLMVGGQLSLAGGLSGSIVRHHDGAWCHEVDAVDRTLWWVHGPRPGEWYAVGEAGRILHETDGVRRREDVPTDATLYGVWAAEDGVVWAVGGDVRTTGLGEVWRRDGGVWSLFAADLPGVAFKVWDRWIVGDGIAYHVEDDLLVEVPVPEGTRLLTVRGRSDTDLWAVGGSSNATMLHGDGVSWTAMEVDPHCGAQPLNGVWTGAGDDVWIAGNNGSMGRLTEDGTWECSFPPVTDESFHAVWNYDGEMYWAGGNLFGTGDNHGTVAHYGATGAAVSLPCDPPEAR